MKNRLSNERGAFFLMAAVLLLTTTAGAILVFEVERNGHLRVLAHTATDIAAHYGCLARQNNLANIQTNMDLLARENIALNTNLARNTPQTRMRVQSGGGPIVATADISFPVRTITMVGFTLWTPYTVSVRNRAELEDFDIIIVLDGSGSMYTPLPGATGTTGWTLAVEAATNICNGLVARNKSAIIVFDTGVQVFKNFGPSQGAADANGLAARPIGWNTNIYGGLREALLQIRNGGGITPGRRLYVFLMSDGSPNEAGPFNYLYDPTAPGLAIGPNFLKRTPPGSGNFFYMNDNWNYYWYVYGTPPWTSPALYEWPSQQTTGMPTYNFYTSATTPSCNYAATCFNNLDFVDEGGTIQRRAMSPYILGDTYNYIIGDINYSEVAGISDLIRNAGVKEIDVVFYGYPTANTDALLGYVANDPAYADSYTPPNNMIAAYTHPATASEGFYKIAPDPTSFRAFIDEYIKGLRRPVLKS